MTASQIRTVKLCSVPECGLKATGRGWCQKHYHRWHRYGDPNVSTHPEHGATPEDKFRHYMPGSPPQDGSCWEWPGSKTEKGYGDIRGEGRKSFRAHRVAYLIFKGEEPGPILRHTCDNPPCCNPDHLLRGTARDNSQDMVDRGRSSKGERSPLSKMTDADVIAMRHLWGLGTKQAELAAMFGVTRSNVSMIVNRKTWSHVA